MLLTLQLHCISVCNAYSLLFYWVLALEKNIVIVILLHAKTRFLHVSAQGRALLAVSVTMLLIGHFSALWR